MKIKKMNRFVKIITFGQAYAVCLAPFGIYIDDNEFPSETINHEMIHWKQQIEMLIIPFYLWYFFEWIIKVVFPPRGAYIDLSFEREAYGNEADPDYLSSRLKFAWWKYLTKKYFIIDPGIESPGVILVKENKIIIIVSTENMYLAAKQASEMLKMLSDKIKKDAND